MTKSKYLETATGDVELSEKASLDKSPAFQEVLQEALQQVPTPPDIPVQLYYATAEVLGFLEDVAATFDHDNE